MYTFEHSVFINRPVQEVFDFVSEPTNHPKFGPPEIHEWTSEGAPRVGSTTRTVSQFLGRTVEITEEITSWEVPHKISSKTTNCSIISRSQWAFEAKDNGTLITFSGEAENDGFFTVAEEIVGKQLDKQIPTDLNALKVLLEAG